MIYLKSKEGAMNLYISKKYDHAGQKLYPFLYLPPILHGEKNKNMEEEGIACPSFFGYVCYNRGKREPIIITQH